MNVLISWQSVRQLLFQIISVWQSADQLTHDVFPKAATNMLTRKILNSSPRVFKPSCSDSPGVREHTVCL